jgi:hypothetical protein
METEIIIVYNDEEPNGLQPIILPVPPSSDVSGKRSKTTASARERDRLQQPKSLRPGQAGLAWERIKRIVRDHCNHPAHEPFACHISGGVIEFRCASDGPAVALIREDEQILLCMNEIQEAIHIVGLKTKGVGFEWRRHRYTATRVIIEIVCEARTASEKLASLDATAALTKHNGRRQRRTTGTTARKRKAEA